MTKKLNGLRTIAVIEAIKGALAFMVAIGLHSMAGQNIQEMAERLVTHLHLNPASHYPSILIQTATQISDTNINLIAGGVVLYTCIRFIEAYGLWLQKRWTEWFALISGGVYVPFEIRELMLHVNWVTIAAFSINVMVIWYLVFIMFKSHKAP
jgi:uncharacterized membrane protein (DUF2068 family)